jgi:Amt family ammonium transporter
MRLSLKNMTPLAALAGAVLAPALAFAQDAATATAPAVAAAAPAAAPAPVLDSGATAWMLTSTCLVLLMVPGLALFYAGLVRTKNVLGTMMHSFIAMALIGVSWVVVGYAMCFGWDPAYLGLSGIDAKDGGLLTVCGITIPHFVFIMFQGKFAIIAPALIAGAFAERVKFSSYCLFILLWSVLVYCPLCHIIWGGGFLSTGGNCEAIDLAGGTVIHISAGVAGLVAALYLGARRGYPKQNMSPNNLTMTLLGAGLLWVGWFGFNSGSTVQSGLDTGRSLAMTQVAAAAGALAWVLIEAIKHKKATSLGFVSGMLAGLVAITPAANAVTPVGAIALGVLATAICFVAVQLKNKFGYDDTLDVFGIHGIAGIVGALALVFFLRVDDPSTLATGGAKTAMGQLIKQLEGVGLSIAVSGVLTLVILFIVDKTIGFRLSAQDEQAGMDHALHGEHGYGLLNLN